ncbi:MAG: glycosyltransferase family 4 protein [Kiloniellaceae bacterium]
MATTMADAPAATQSLTDCKRVLHVSSAHRVSDGRIAEKEADTLWAAGYDVTVLALEKASGALLPDGPRFVQYDVPASRIRRFLIRLPWLLAYCVKHRYDVYHLHDPDLILLGFVLKLVGRRVVYDVHESYPMVVLDRDWIPRLLRPLLSRLWRSSEAAFVRRADLTIAAHDSVKQQFDGGRVITVHNFPLTEDKVASTFIAMAQRRCRAMYHGDLTVQRGLLTMIDAVAQVNVDVEPELRLGGSLSPDLLEKIRGRAGMRRTVYLGWLNRVQLAEELAQARAGLVLLHPTNNYMMIQPNKLFEYMAAGLPVIASDFRHWREVVESADCGILVDPLDCSAIAKALEYLFAHPDEAAAMGARGREAVMTHYNWGEERHKLTAGYKLLFATEPPGAC